MRPRLEPLADEPRATIRWYGALADLTDADRDGIEEPRVGEPRSIKDLIESRGVPHTEVGALVVDGDQVGFERLIVGGERIAVYPDPPPFGADQLLRPPRPDPPAFVLDVHLGRLARHLRLIGFDTWYDREADDMTLAHVASADGRVLVTRDRGLLMRREVIHGHLVRSTDPEAQLDELVTRLNLSARAAPYTRCLACNGPLEVVAKQEIIEDLPPRTREEHDRFVRCRSCDRIYWPGSHTVRLDRIIRRALAGSVKASAGSSPCGQPGSRSTPDGSRPWCSSRRGRSERSVP